MRPRLLVIGTLAGTVVLFAWQSISHGVIKLPEMGLREFPNDSTSTATAQAIRALAPQNGVYFSAYGVFGAVHISADYADKRKQFGSMMGKQLALDLAVVFLLTLLVDRLRGESIVRTAGAYSVLALAWAGLIHVGNEIWWSFPTAWTLGNSCLAATPLWRAAHRDGRATRCLRAGWRCVKGRQGASTQMRKRTSRFSVPAADRPSSLFVPESRRPAVRRLRVRSRRRQRSPDHAAAHRREASLAIAKRPRRG